MTTTIKFKILKNLKQRYLSFFENSKINLFLSQILLQTIQIILASAKIFIIFEDLLIIS